MAKSDLLLEVYRLKNQVAEVNGTQQIDLDELVKSPRFYQQLKDSKVYELEDQIQGLNRAYQRAVDEKQRAERTAVYYATPEGMAHKEHLESAIKSKETAWQQTIRQNALHIEQQLQQHLGTHWGVQHYDRGIIRIGVIDAGKSKPQQRDYYFGQEVEIRLDENRWVSEQGQFTINCGTTGSFSMEGGKTVGERALFYIGLGQLFSNSLLVNDIRNTMTLSTQTMNGILEELTTLRDQLRDPLKQKERQNTSPDDSPKHKEQQKKAHNKSRGLR